MKILAVGDVTEPRAVSYLAEHLPPLRQKMHLDFVIVNAENAGFIFGPDPDLAKELLHAGADVLTGGNHTLQKKSLHPLLDASCRLIRPANYPPEVPGIGYTILPAAGRRLLVMNAIGRVNMEPCDCPFRAVDRILAREAGSYDLALLDFHAEATGEKLAMGRYLDGRVSAVFGTHTHVPTADEQILPNGTAYISDIGMCGAADGILGIDPSVILKRFLTRLPERYQPATGPVRADAVLFTLDDASSSALSVERIRF